MWRWIESILRHGNICSNMCSLPPRKRKTPFFLLGFFQPWFLFKGYIQLYICILLYIVYIYTYSTYSVIWCQIRIYLTCSINLKAAKSQSFWETPKCPWQCFFVHQKNVRDPNESKGWNSTWLSHDYLTILDIKPSQSATIWTTIYGLWIKTCIYLIIFSCA